MELLGCQRSLLQGTSSIDNSEASVQLSAVEVLSQALALGEYSHIILPVVNIPAEGGPLSDSALPGRRGLLESHQSGSVEPL